MRKKNIFCLMLDEFQLKVLSKYSNGISRLACFSYLVSHAMRQKTDHTKRGITYTVPMGCLDISEEELASLWQCNRTTVHRMLKEWQDAGLITMSANNVTTIVGIICLQSWYVGRSEKTSFPRNDAFRYPDIMTDKPEDDLLPVRKQNTAATDKKTSSKKKASKASQSADTDSEAKDDVGTEEATEIVATTVTHSLISEADASGQESVNPSGSALPSDATQNAAPPVETVPEVRSEQAGVRQVIQPDLFGDSHETFGYETKASDESTPTLSGSAQAQQNLRPQTEPAT